MSLNRAIFLLLLCVVFVEAKIVLGVVPSDNKRVLLKRFTPLVKYLSTKTHEKVVLKIGRSYKAVHDDLISGKIDFAYIGPFAAYKAMKKNRYVMPVVKIMSNNKPYYRVAIITNKKSDIKSLREYNGRYFAFGDNLSASTYYVPRYMLHLRGVNLKQLSKYNFIGNQSTILSKTIRGKIDGGAIKETLAKKYANKIKILEISNKILNYTICANLKFASRCEMTKIKKALLGLKDKNILKYLGKEYTGFKRAFKTEYKKLSKLYGKK